MQIFKQTKRSPDERAADLLSRMNLEEKIAQIRSIWGYDVMVGRERFSLEKAERLLKHGIGHITRPGGGTDLEPLEVAQFVSEVQHFLVENTRLGVPAILHEECLMGYQTKGATAFPQIIGIASAWDPDVIAAMVEIIRKQLSAVGIAQALAPVLDIARDARWGRVEETFGEDPYLTATLATAYVKALQRDASGRIIAATVKHFAGYGASEAGLNWAPAHIPPRELREVFLYPFEAAVREAKVLSVMNAYHEIDGIPCGASPDLLTKVLRDEWGFDGIVVADYDSIRMLAEYHRLVEDLEHAGRIALEAGIDIELPGTECFNEKFTELVSSGIVPREAIDRAVLRVLTVKFRLGLFENPYPSPGGVVNIFDTPEQRAVAREVARKSIVLLKNEGKVLPLDRSVKTIAVIGPNADSWRNMLGDYGYPSIVELRRVFDDKLPVEQLRALPNPSVPVVTILQGIQAKASPQTRVLYAKGCEVLGPSTEGIAEAVRVAHQADVIILVVGGKSGFMPDCTCGEERDRAELGLLGFQVDLVRAVHGVGKPTVLVLVDGRPLAIPWIAENMPAIVEAWLPGEEAGNAVADVLFGDFNPGGRLPITFPAHVGQVPVYYGHKPSAARSHLWGDYVDATAKPLFPFGHGLSYTSFEYSGLAIHPEEISASEPVNIECEVRNVGASRGDEVVQLYIRDIVASVTRPVKELKGFKRLTLDPGQRQKVSFLLPTDLLAFYNRPMELIVEPGDFEVMIGSSSEDIRLRGKFLVVGPERILERRQALFSAVS